MIGGAERARKKAEESARTLWGDVGRISPGKLAEQGWDSYYDGRERAPVTAEVEYAAD